MILSWIYKRLNRDRTLLYAGRTRLMLTCVLGRYGASTVLLVPKLQALVYDILPSFGGRCRKAMLGVWLVPKPFGRC